MSQPDQDGDSAGIGAAGKIAIGAIIAGALVIAAWAIVPAVTRDAPRQPAPVQPPASDGTYTSQAIAAQIEGSPESGEIVRALRTHYPRDHQALVQQLTQAANRNRGHVGVEARAFIGDFMRSKLDALSRAPGASLTEIGRELAGLARTLHDEDVALCASWSRSGFPIGTTFSSAVMARLNRIGALQIVAARAGEDGAEAARGPLSEAERMAWHDRIRAIFPGSAALIGRSQEEIDAAPEADQCRLRTALYQAAAELPPELSANVMAHVLRRSFPERR